MIQIPFYVFYWIGGFVIVMVIAFVIWYLSERKKWDEEMREYKKKKDFYSKNDIRIF